MVISQEDIRMFLVDYPEVNKLLDKEEFSPERIMAAIKMTVMRFNEMSPHTRYLPETFPFKYMLLIGVVAHLLKSEVLYRNRNRLQYNDGGISIDDNAMADTYAAIMGKMDLDFKEAAKSKKIEINASLGWSSISSPYGACRSIFHN